MSAGTAVAGQGGRVQLEDWSALPLYLLPEHWQMLQSSSSPAVLRAQELLDWSIRLGLRHPSEQTLAMIARLVSLPEPILEANRQKLHQTLLMVKSVAKTRLLRARLAGRAQASCGSCRTTRQGFQHTWRVSSSRMGSVSRLLPW